MNDSTLVLTSDQFLHAKIQGELESLINWLYPFGLRVIRGINGLNEDEQKEVFSSKMKELHEGLLGAESPGQFAGWVKRVLRNAALDRLAQKHKDGAFFKSIEDLKEFAGDALSIDKLALTPGTALALVEEVRHFTEKLDDDDSTLLTLMLGDATADEMCAELDIDVGALYVRKNRLRKQLNDLKQILHEGVKP